MCAACAVILSLRLRGSDVNQSINIRLFDVKVISQMSKRN